MPTPQTLCPDLRPYWQLGRSQDVDTVLLQCRQGQQQYALPYLEAVALRYFVGRYTVAQVQQRCEQDMGGAIPSDLVAGLVQRLIGLGVLASGEEGDGSQDSAFNSQDLPGEAEPPGEVPSQRLGTRNRYGNNPNTPIPQHPNTPPTPLPPHSPPPPSQWQLKPAVQWVQTEDGHWILRNLEDFTFMQVPGAARPIVEALGREAPGTVARQYGLAATEVRSLLQQLAMTGMVVGTHPPEPPKGKFKPTQLLFFKLSLCNPDGWLTRTFPAIAWIWSRPFALSLAGFLAVCAVVGMAQSQAILYMGMNLWQAMGPGVFLPFGLLAMTVVTIHELGHAYTLKHYGGIVPEVGLLFMCLMPAAYTNTTDQYALPKRSQRVLVVAAGVLCQLTIASLAWVLWNLSVPGSWLAVASYLLLVAALFTVALNLNPLARFDGYYLLIALTGVNNLRSRSFAFYKCLLLRHPCQEPAAIRWILALYAPVSFIYLLLVFGHLFLWLSQWVLLNAPFLTLGLLALWAVYYYWPEGRMKGGG
ncbi:M50 family metallopeptidase [Leptolyngbya sp. PCC 6406]|uniref:M50 family metallopeptidase n=1 Tax=Leptolyngbya sp. PCC 6406 TaxID=1173264 RepID=UPI0002ACC437|nr:M50 family metallopeptidase [Leptolyngbya sp. PCC 6406]